MKNKSIQQIISILMLLFAAVLILWSRFSNPDMTEIRWFITYWKEILLYLVTLIVGVLLYERFKPTTKS